MNQKLLEYNEYYINELVNYKNYNERYKIYNIENIEIGSIVEVLDTKNKIANLFFSRKHTPFNFEIKDMDDNLVGVISRRLESIQ